MYKSLLIFKYLRKRRIAWVSLVAVMLCTAMVLVVISVMGGWLRTFKDSFHGMTSDVVVEARSLVGFPYYGEMIDEIQKLPDVRAAVPLIRSFGLINIGNQIRQGVEVTGMPIDRIGQVSDFPTSLHLQSETRDKWKSRLLALADTPGLSAELVRQLRESTERPSPNFDLLPDIDYKLIAGPKAKNPTSRPGMIVSSSLVSSPHEDEPPQAMYELPTTLTLVPVSPNQATRPEDAVTPAFWIVDTSKSRIWQLDANRVYVPFDELQKDLRMAAFGDEPARASEIQIKARPGVDLLKLRDKVQTIVSAVNLAHDVPRHFSCKVSTWEQIQGAFIDAVEHEVVLTTILFAIISLVSVFLIFCIFYMIVVEKTKDIGIIKSVGATSAGVAGIFLGYGLVIGILGAGGGLGLAYVIVRYINQLHNLLARVMGVVIWSPETYQFDMIPNTMNWHQVWWIVGVAILSALLGAIVPAVRAAAMAPVDALRYE